MEISDDEYRKLVLEVAAARGIPTDDAPPTRRGIIRRLWGFLGNLVIFILIGLVILVFALAARVQYGVPIPLPDSLVSTAGVTFSTSAAPLPTARQGKQQPAPALVPFYRATEEPAEQPTGEETQMAATATAFIEDVPTAPPAFVEYVDEQCRDPEKVKASATLQLFCGGGE